MSPLKALLKAKDLDKLLESARQNANLSVNVTIDGVTKKHALQKSNRDAVVNIKLPSSSGSSSTSNKAASNRTIIVAQKDTTATDNVVTPPSTSTGGAGGSSTGGTLNTRPPTGDDLLSSSAIFPASASLLVAAKSIETTAQLRGFPEYTDISSPPRYYLSCNYSGQIWENYTVNGVVTDPHCGVLTLSGSAVINPTDGSLSSLGAWTLSGREIASSNGTLNGPSLAGSVAYNGYLGAQVSTATTVTAPASGAIVAYNGFSDSWWWLKFDSGAVSATLSAEDTDAAALARATPSGLWDSQGWASVSVASNLPAARAYWQRRLAGTTFSILEGRLRVQAKGFFASWEYTITCRVYRRAQGTTDAYTQIDSIERTLTTDGDGNGEVVIQVPNEISFETYLSMPAISSR